MNTTTCTAGAEMPTNPRELIERVVAAMEKIGPEPFGEWMRQQGHPPEHWTLYLPKSFTSDGTLLPRYVVLHPLIEKPVFVSNGVADGWR